MNTVGDKARFAIEYGLNANCGGEWLYGHVRFWIDGGRVGDDTQGTSLRDFLFSSDRLRSERGRRVKPEVDVFDHWKIYLVETSEHARVIYKYRDDPVRECLLRAGEFDDVLDQACEHLDALLQQSKPEAR